MRRWHIATLIASCILVSLFVSIASNLPIRPGEAGALRTLEDLVAILGEGRAARVVEGRAGSRILGMAARDATEAVRLNVRPARVHPFWDLADSKASTARLVPYHTDAKTSQALSLNVVESS